MPTIEVPLKSWTDIPELRRSKKFRTLAAKAVELAKRAKTLKAERELLSLELFDFMDATLDDQTKSVGYPIECPFENCPRDIEGEHTHMATLTKRKGGKNVRLDKQALFAFPLPCSNPKCKTVNHLTADAYEACQKRGEDRRPGVSVKLPGEENGDE